MIRVVATNITSPLGFTTEQNYRAVMSGSSALKCYAGLWGLPEPFAASLFSEAQKQELAISGHTFFEALAIRSVREALSHTELDVASPRVVLILSTTKGDIGSYPSDAAQTIAKAVGISTKPIVVCNACVSGLSAQLLANNLLSAGLYDYAIVVGAEVQSKFIVSGFQSLKAVSEAPCRPFDIERNGLNPGEAAATIVYSAPLQTSPREGRLSLQRIPPSSLVEGMWEGTAWHLMDGAVCNDAFHIVSPSPQGDGCFRAVSKVMKGHDKQQLATVCAHGTATLFNDQMESKAIERAGLSDIPLSALKGYYGHTMGAAGVLETILTMRATDDGIVLPIMGFAELGVSGKVSISSEPRPTNKLSFLKTLSGFGGCNVAALYERRAIGELRSTKDEVSIEKTRTVRLSSEDGQSLIDIYKQAIGGYPRFYKMDILSRLAFVAVEMLSDEVHEGSSLILFNHSSSMVSDRQFLATISGPDFFPSPSVFVYTLPNIAAGEVAIRHHLQGETSFYILPDKDEALMQQILEASLRASGATSAICGWIDAESETNYECELSTYNIITQ